MVEAVRMVFQCDGMAAQMDAIAAEAGLDVLIAERMQQLLFTAVSAAENADAWAAVEDLVWRFAAFEAKDRGMADILADYRSRAIDTPDAPVAHSWILARDPSRLP